MKTYRRHYCNRTHRDHNTAARCIWPRAVWVTGTGPYATLAWCRVLTVTLWPTIAEAEQAKAFIDEFDCGGACRRQHEIVHLDLPGPRHTTGPVSSGDVSAVAGRTCCGEQGEWSTHHPDRRLVNGCQLCPRSPTYWRHPTGSDGSTPTTYHATASESGDRR